MIRSYEGVKLENNKIKLFFPYSFLFFSLDDIVKLENNKIK